MTIAIERFISYKKEKMIMAFELASERNITIYKSLELNEGYIDNSLKLEDGVKVFGNVKMVSTIPTFMKSENSFDIKAGTHKYENDDVLNWPTLKNLIKNKIVRLIASDLEDQLLSDKKLTKKAQGSPSEREYEVAEESDESSKVPKTKIKKSLKDMAE